MHVLRATKLVVLVASGVPGAESGPNKAKLILTREAPMFLAASTFHNRSLKQCLTGVRERRAYGPPSSTRTAKPSSIRRAAGSIEERFSSSSDRAE